MNIKKIRPMANYVLTTSHKYMEDDISEGGVITRVKGSLKEYQEVVAVGPVARGVQPGDIVCINPKRYAKYKHNPGSLKDGVITDNPVVSYNFNVIELDHEPHLLITDQDIDFVIEEYEDTPAPKTNIIIPDRKIII